MASAPQTSRPLTLGEAALAMNRPRVLFVEDDDELREIFVRTLRSAGCDVAAAYDGVDALRLLYEVDPGARDFDVVVSDLSMPRMSGIELVKRIRHRSGSQMVIFVTAYCDERVRDAARRVSVTTILEKPLRLGMFRDAVLEASHGQ